MSSQPFFGLHHTIHRINQGLCEIVSWGTLLMVCLTCLVVILRYGFGLGWVAMQESVLYLHAAVLLLGSAYTLRVNEHVRVDIFYRQRSERGKAWVDIVGGLCFAMPTLIFILVFCWDYVMRSWALLEGSSQTGGLPLLFLFKSLVLVFALTMLLQVVANILENILTLRTPAGGAA